MNSDARLNGDVAVLLSGGLDSVTLLYEAEAAGRLRGAWFVNYWQGAASQERVAALRFIDELGLVGGEISLLIPGVVAMLQEPGAEGLRVVPARNAILLMLVAAWANAYSIREVWYGATLGDEEYPDCTPRFVASLNATLSLVLPVRVRAPWLELGYAKADVVRRARELGVPIEQTWSCYTPMIGLPCGTCSACQRRATALGDDGPGAA